MKDKQSFTQYLNELRNRTFTEEDFIDAKDIELEEDKLYTPDELKESLLDMNGLNSIVHDFTKSDGVVKQNKLYLSFMPKEYTEGTELDYGVYIGLGVGAVKNDEDFNSLKGQFPRSLYNSAIAIKPIFYIQTEDVGYTQAQLLEDIKDPSKVKNVEGKDDIKLVSNEEVEYLEVVDKSFFEDRINEMLDRYDEFDNAKDTLAYYSKLFKMVGNERMVYCHLLDKNVMVF